MKPSWQSLRYLLGYPVRYLVQGMLLPLLSALLMLQVSVAVPAANQAASPIASAAAQAERHHVGCTGFISRTNAGGGVRGDQGSHRPQDACIHASGNEARADGARLAGIGARGVARLVALAGLPIAQTCASPGGRHESGPHIGIPPEADLDGDSDPVAIPARSENTAHAQSQFRIVTSAPALPLVVQRDFIPPSWRTS